ncbi:uncharacterized protein LOC115301365 isoform X5 [Suricata suricatta]|uniref:uncharacterized protein LOC115301365 isoform X5 n=1 Tax=Suricata suricatta TaxID=37032 RepID=UPI0011555DBD|nr:uncharacterized protein LOC115301365 isoform X5 [Suricata suricatta]
MPPREPTSSNCERWSQVPGRLRREGVEGAHARAAGRQAAPAETWTWGYQAARKPTVRGSPGLRTGTPSRGNLTAALSQRSGRLSDANGHPGRSGRRPHITIGTPVTAHCPLGRGSFHITCHPGGSTRDGSVKWPWQPASDFPCSGLTQKRRKQKCVR